MIPILESARGYDEAAPTSIGRSRGFRAQVAALGAIGAIGEALYGLTGLHDHTGGHVGLAVGRDRRSHDLDQLGREQRVPPGVLDPIWLVTPDPDLHETRSPELLGEDTLRQGAGHSAGPRALVVRHLRWQLTLDRQVGQ